MCEFVEDTPESYDDVMTSGLNSEMKKGVLLMYYYFVNFLKYHSKIKIITGNILNYIKKKSLYI